jgi:hypothetical protein
MSRPSCRGGHSITQIVMNSSIPNSTVVICHAGTPMLPLAQAYDPDQDEGVCDGTTDY